MDYQTFLESKRQTVTAGGFDVAPAKLNSRMFRFQVDICRWALRLGKSALFLGVGMGKTLIQTEWARHVAEHTGGQVLILAPLAVADQTVREGEKFGIEVKHVFDQSEVGSAPIVVTNYDRLHLFDVTRFVGVVLDECFAPDTPIDVVNPNGAIGQKPISQVRVGDKIMNASGVDRVADVHRREVPYAVKVTIAGKDIIASPNHPFFTQRGWVGAQDLQPGDEVVPTDAAVRMVRQGIHHYIFSRKTQTVLRAILLSEMADEPAGASGKSSFAGSGSEAWQENTSLVAIGRSKGESEPGTYSQSQSDGRPGNAEETLPHIESQTPQTFRAWGQWNWLDRATAEALGCTWEWLDGGVCFVTGPTASGLPDALQAGYSQRREENRNRGGWTLASCAKSAGREENRQTKLVRVDGIEILELGHPELAQYRDATGKLYFYDIGATRHPSFSVNGLLVHNSSILKHYSKTFFDLTHQFTNTPFRLCATATPAPNDFVEFGNHAMFLGVMHFKDMLARWFVGEGDLARSARLKGYARSDFWRWLTEWAVCISRPADLGAEYDMPGYDLPPLHIHDHRLPASEASIQRAWDKGLLLPDVAPSATTFQQVKRDSLNDRVRKAQEIVEAIADHEPIILWCDTDYEADALQAVFPDALEVRGSHSTKVKEERLRAFSTGQARIIITKPEIAGFGLNWQHCCHAVYVGVSFSFERTYQSLGRIHRYGQEKDVHIHMIYAETEGNVKQLLDDKRRAFDEMQAEMNAAMREHGLFREVNRVTFTPTQHAREAGQDWTYFLGDCVEVMQSLPDSSVDFCVHSPPFSSLYIYSDKAADMGNAATKDEFFAHYDYVIRELYRVTAPGRACAVHVKDLPLFINRDSVMGIDPFSDDVAAAFRRAGWVLQSRITVGKDPVIEMQKTNSHGLLYKNWKEKAQALRVGLPDYVLVFRKFPLDGEADVHHDPQDLTYFGDNAPGEGEWLTLPSRGTGKLNTSLPVWQRYANPIWDDVTIPAIWSDINQMDTLNYLVAKENQDERHICPLQLDLVARLIHWYTNPGETVLDPFAGIGSTGYEALKLRRKFVGIELKESYHALGTKYLREAELLANQPTLFDWAEAQKAVGE